MKVTSKFGLFMQTDLSSSDFKVLTFLYQPLVGVEAYSLYSTFYHLAKRRELMSHRSLFDILNIKQEDFSKYRDKLEAVGLLETYKKNESEYLYILKPPFGAKQFLVDTFLGTYLESEIGTKNLEILLEIFKINKPDIQGFENVTKSFDDLYEFDSTKLLQVDYDLEGRNGNNSKLIRNTINYEEFVDKLPRALMSTSLLNANFRQKIMQLAFVYQFSVDDLVEIYQNAHKGRKNITVEQINLQAKMYYEQHNHDLVIKEKELSEDEVISNLSYKTIVDRFVSEEATHKAMALATINEFISQNEIEPGVFNVLLIFILKNKSGILPHVNYLNKVWESWQRNGVQTANDAINYKESIEKNWTSKAQIKKVNKPDWLDEYIKEISEMEG